MPKIAKKSTKPKLENGWRYLEDEVPPKGKNVLVTNNINARLNDGTMSHLWISAVYKNPDSEGYHGRIFGPTISDSRMIYELVAWHPLPGSPVISSRGKKF